MLRDKKKEKKIRCALVYTVRRRTIPAKCLIMYESYDVLDGLARLSHRVPFYSLSSLVLELTPTLKGTQPGELTSKAYAEDQKEKETRCDAECIVLHSSGRILVHGCETFFCISRLTHDLPQSLRRRTTSTPLVNINGAYILPLM